MLPVSFSDLLVFDEKGICVFRKEFKGEIVLDETLIPDQTDYRSTLLKIPETAEAIAINKATGTSAIYMMKQLHELGNELPIYANFIAFNS